MNKHTELISILKGNIRKSKEKNIITKNSIKFTGGIKELNIIKLQKLCINDDFIELYSYSDGFEIIWFSNPTEGIGGRIKFLKIEQVLQDWKEIIYFEEDIEVNDEIKYFHPFDLATDESQCGFLITPDFVSESIYYNRTGNPELHDLDLDFDGYMEMAIEARGFFYWQLVLLDLQKGNSSSVTDDFKKHMPVIFNNDSKAYLNFNWDDFVNKYDSLRLSKRGK